MRMLKNIKLMMFTLLLALPMQTEAGTWSYNCEGADSSIVSCGEISKAAAPSVTNIFTSQYPDDKYLILFTLTTGSHSNGSFSFSMVASLYKTYYKASLYGADDGPWLRSPSIMGFSRTGHVPKASPLQKKQLLLKAAKITTDNLVSYVTKR